MMDLDRLKKLYREFRDSTADARRESDKAFDYYDNKQLSKGQIRTLRERKAPEIWINRVAPAVNGILGVLEKGQTDPRAYPRNGEDEGMAEVATDSLRYAAETSRWQRTALATYKNLFIGGIGAVIVEVNEKLDPSPRLIRHGEFCYDPHSRDPDFEDARWMGVAKWMYVDTVKGLYPDADIDPQALSPAGMEWDDTDKPEHTLWGDTARNRVLVAEFYVNDGGWQREVFWGGDHLERGRSPYVNETGIPSNPIVAQSCFVDRDNARYGVVKAMLPIQDEINMRRQRALHLANSRQVRLTDPNGPELDANVIRKEAARPDGVLPLGVEPSMTGDMQNGQIMLLQEAKAEIERMGPNPAVLGQGSTDASGRAQLVRQQAGLTELTPALGAAEDLELRVYRLCWERIRQFWTEPKMIRVTDDIGAPKFMTVNEPIVQEVQGIVAGPDGQPQSGMQRVVTGVKNRPAEMDMDILIDSVPDTATIQQEQFASLVELAKMYGPQEVPFDDILEASSLPKKRELIEKRKSRQQEAAQGQGPQQEAAQAAMQAGMAEQAAKAQSSAAKAALDGARAEGQSIENHANALQLGFAAG